MVTVTEINQVDISPKVADPEARKLLPTVLKPQQFSFVLGDTNNAVANAIRRVICLELPVRAMIAEYSDVETDDPHIIPEMIIKRLRMIPLAQSCPLDMTFSLTATAERTVMEVKTGMITPARGKPVFNETTTLLDLQPGKHISISNIRVQEKIGNAPGDGMHCVATQVVAIPVDVDPETTSSSVADPHTYRIQFNTNGTIAPKELVATACDRINKRLAHVKSILPTITNNGDEYHLTIPGETDTIGNLFMRALEDHTIVCDVKNGSCRVRMRADDATAAIEAAIANLTKVFNSIKSSIG